MKCGPSLVNEAEDLESDRVCDTESDSSDQIRKEGKKINANLLDESVNYLIKFNTAS